MKNSVVQEPLPLVNQTRGRSESVRMIRTDTPHFEGPKEHQVHEQVERFSLVFEQIELRKERSSTKAEGPLRF